MNGLRTSTSGAVGTILVAATLSVGMAVVAASPAAAEATPPTIAISTPTEGRHYALNAAVTAAWHCDDPGPGASGVATCAAAGPASTATAGPHTFTVNASDHDGNVASSTVNYVVDPDTTAPTITIGSPVDGRHYAFGAAINATYSCDDTGGSGIAGCTAATPILTTAGTHAFTVNATDGAGNAASRTVHYTVDPDTTPPTITIASPVNGRHYPLGQTINATFRCDDPGSSIAACAAATAINGSVGTHVFTVNATDNAGNAATRSVTYVVDPPPAAPIPGGESGPSSGSGTPDTTSSTPRLTLPTRASRAALARGVTVKLSRLKPRSRVVLRVRRGSRTIKVIRATADSGGRAKLRLSLSRRQLTALRGKTLTLRFSTTAAGGTRKVMTRRLKVV